MARSVSWVMGYHRRPQGEPDRVGGLPNHLPHVWPRCQLCQDRMEFVGQVYSSERLLLDAALGLQFYICDGCRETYNGQANDRLPIHMEVLSEGAAENVGREGVRCRKQPLLHITYTPVEDSMDQWAFHRRRLAEEELTDTHLRRDKVGGLFPYDGADGPRITPANRMVAQFTWAGVGGPIYLFRSSVRGLYLYHYR
jgi:hypothetical protein